MNQIKNTWKKGKPYTFAPGGTKRWFKPLNGWADAVHFQLEHRGI